MSAQIHPKAKKIQAINQQLINEFHPAVKKVSTAGQNLIQAYENVNKAVFTYTASLYALSHSGRNLDTEAKEQAEQLQKAAEAFKQINSEHLKWIDYFSKLITITAHNYSTEKDRIKHLFNKYAKNEKQMVKANNKGKQSYSQLDNFYSSALETLLHEQYQRYSFFTQRHLEVLKRHLIWSKFSTVLLENEFIFAESASELNSSDDIHRNKTVGPDEQNHLDDLYQSAEEAVLRLERSQSDGIQTLAESEKTLTIQGGYPIDNNNTENELHEQKTNSYEKNKFSPNSFRRESWSNSRKYELSDSPHNSRNSSLSPLSHKEHNTNNKNLEMLIEEKKSETENIVQNTEIEVAQSSNGHISKESEFYKENKDFNENSDNLTHNQTWKYLPSNIYKATPIVALLQQNNAKPTSYVESKMNFDENLQNDRQSLRNVPLANRDNNNLDRKYFPITFNPHLNSRSRESLNVLPITNPPNFFTSQRDISMGEKSPEKTRKPIVPLFSTSDYGRNVECIKAYEGNGSSQLSLKVGDQVILVKCGTRGWVLGRNIDATKKNYNFMAVVHLRTAICGPNICGFDLWGKHLRMTFAN